MQAAKYKINKFLGVLLFNTSLFCMIGSNTIAEHAFLAYNSPHHEAASLIIDSTLGFSQSGVLLKDNIVLTAAHGMKLLLDAKYPVKDYGPYIVIQPKTLTVTFSNSIDTMVTYDVESVLLDSRYIRFEAGDQHKFDIAFLKLKKTVLNIAPVELSQNLELEPDTPMLILTWGNSDYPTQKIKRGFYLFEWSLFFPNTDEDPLANYRTVMLSSIFFDPANQLPAIPNVNESESTQRRYFALKSWIKNKRPYGLALPGTSGAPVFIEQTVLGNKRLVFLGLVMGYATLGDEMTLLSKNLNHTKQSIYNRYQTIITTPFRLDMQPKSNTTRMKHFSLDKRYIKMINDFSKGIINP